MGRAHRQKGDYDEALKVFKQQLLLAQEVGDQSQEATLQSSIGTLLYYQEEYSDALPHFNEANRIYTELGARLTIGHSFMNRGNMLWQLGHYKRAEAEFAQALSIAENQDSNYKQLLALIHLFSARMALSQQKFQDAKVKSEQSLRLAGTQYKDIAIQAEYTLGLAQALTGEAQAGRVTCEKALAAAIETKNPRLIAYARLALAEAMLESGDYRGAYQTAEQAQGDLSRMKQHDSEWRAHLIAARASQRAGDRADVIRGSALIAVELFSGLNQRWGEDNYKAYVARPDIESYSKQLDQILAVSK